MKIVQSTHKPGCYAQKFEVLGIDERTNEKCWFLIYSDQAKTYLGALRFWYKTWGGREFTSIYLRHAEPMDLVLAC